MSRTGAVAALVTVLAWPATAPAATTPGLDEALAAQRRLVEEQPADAAARTDLGNLLLLVGEVEAASAAYQEALRLEPEAVLARYNLGLLELERGRLGSARRHFERLLAEPSIEALAHYRLGEVAAAHDHDARAVRQYEKAFRLDPALAEPATHPHVLFNDLANWARHRAYLAPTPGLLPRRYAEPSRLAGLMMGAGGEGLATPAEPVAPPPDER